MGIDRKFSKINIDEISEKIGLNKIINLFKKSEEAIIVDISSNLKLLNIRFGSELKIKSLKIFDLPGEKKDNFIINSLKNFIHDNTIVHESAILCPRLESIFIRRIQIPAVPKSELAEAIKWQIKSDLPFDLSKAVMDFVVIKTIEKNDGSKTFEIVVALAEFNEIKQQVLLLKKSGLFCLAVTPLPFAFDKLLYKYFSIGKDESSAILYIGENRCYISIHENEGLKFYRELPASVLMFKDALTGTLISDKGKMELTKEEAEDILSKVGIPKGELVHEHKVSSVQILSLIRPILERLIQEIKRSMTYYNLEFAGPKVRKIFIVFEKSEIPNLDNFIKDELSLDVQMIYLSDRVKVSRSIRPEALVRACAGAGVASGYEKGINLLPYEFHAEKFEKIQKASLYWLTFVVVALLVIFYAFARAQISAYSLRLSNLQLHLNTVSDIKKTKARVDNLASFSLEVLNSNSAADELLKVLSAAASSELFIDDFSLDYSSKSGSMTGFVKSMGKNPENILVKFISDIKKSGSFKSADISSMKNYKELNFKFADFIISFKVP